jgi:hypothetical protein
VAVEEEASSSELGGAGVLFSAQASKIFVEHSLLMCLMILHGFGLSLTMPRCRQPTRREISPGGTKWMWVVCHTERVRAAEFYLMD